MKIQRSRKRQGLLRAFGVVAIGMSLYVPAAKGGFALSFYGDGPVTPPPGDAIPGYSVFVLQALNTGGGTGTGLLGFDLAITANNPGVSLAIDIEQTTSPATGTLYTANVDGSRTIPSTGLFNGGIDAGGQPAFGDTVGGTFLAIGDQPFDPTYQTLAVGKASAERVYVNSQTEANEPEGVPYAPGTVARYSQQTLSSLDAAFKNSGSVNAENIDNGYVNSLEVEDDFGSESLAIPDNVTPIPIANIVIPTGQSFNVLGLMGGETGPAVGVSIAIPEPTSLAILIITGTGLLFRRRRIGYRAN